MWNPCTLGTWNSLEHKSGQACVPFVWVFDRARMPTECLVRCVTKWLLHSTTHTAFSACSSLWMALAHSSTFCQTTPESFNGITMPNGTECLSALHFGHRRNIDRALWWRRIVKVCVHAMFANPITGYRSLRWAWDSNNGASNYCEIGSRQPVKRTIVIDVSITYYYCMLAQFLWASFN